VSFWLDKWLDDKPLCVAYPILFDLCADKRISVHEVWSEGWVIHFQIIPQGLARSQWYELAERLNNVSLNGDNDVPLWRWMANKVFSVKFVYNHLTKHEPGVDYNRIWKAKIPEKIKIFMWLLEQKAVLTKDNMIRRNWQGSPACYFCGEPKNNDHLFFSYPIAKVVWGVVAKCFQQNTRPLCYEQYWQWIKSALPGGESMYMMGVAALCWAIWKARNKTCFEKKFINNPDEIVYSACALTRYWAGLYPEATQQAINEGVDLMICTAIKLNCWASRTRGGA
jgi:hypothetical protein